MSIQQELEQERRARLAAENLLSHRQRELHEANMRLDRHAIALTEEIVEKRNEAASLRGDVDDAQRQAQEANRRLWDSVETIQDGLALFGPDNRLIAANSAYRTIFDNMELVRPGISYADLVEIMLEEGIVDPGEETHDEWRDTMLARWTSSSPQPRTIRLWDRSYLRLLDRRSQSGDTVSLAIDVTETMKTERRLKRATNRAEAANRAKSAFLGRMSHELRTPMNGIVGMADLLAETQLSGDQKLYVETIRGSSDALLSLIRDVLDFSRLEAERLVLSPVEFDLEALVHEVLQLFRPAAVEKGLELVMYVAPSVPARLQGDAGRIRQVVTNLVGNALKFTEEGHVRLTVDYDQRSATATIEVQDTGVGIDASKEEYIFGEFNQLEDGVARSHEGAGLGLTITRQLVELMGGCIGLDDRRGQGACFVVTLPLTALVEAPTCELPEWLRTFRLASPGPGAQCLGDYLAAIGVEPTDASDSDLTIARHEEGAARASRGASPVVWIADAIVGKGPEDDVLGGLFRRADVARALGALQPLPTDTGDASADRKERRRRRRLEDQVDTRGRLMKVLAVEDNKTNRLVFEKLVRPLAINLRFAVNGADAVEQWERFQPDVVFMDISMPVMDGKRATAEIRERESRSGAARTSIVALTAHAVDGDKEDILAAGLDFYLTKPLRKDAIFDRILVACPDDARPVFPDGAAVSEPARDAEPSAAPKRLPLGDDVQSARELWDGLARADGAVASA